MWNSTDFTNRLHTNTYNIATLDMQQDKSQILLIKVKSWIIMKYDERKHSCEKSDIQELLDRVLIFIEYFNPSVGSTRGKEK